MSGKDECKIYEQIAACGFDGGFIHPGGADLTERALQKGVATCADGRICPSELKRCGFNG